MRVYIIFLRLRVKDSHTININNVVKRKNHKKLKNNKNYKNHSVYDFYLCFPLVK